MAKRITEEQKEQINELYLKCGVKKQVAETLGISVSSVSKYLIEGYISKENRAKVQYEIEIIGSSEFSNYLAAASDISLSFCEYCKLSDKEWEEMRELQKSILI